MNVKNRRINYHKNLTFDRNNVLNYLSSIDKDVKLSALILELVDLGKWLSNYDVSLSKVIKNKISNTLNDIFSRKINFFQLFDDTFLILFQDVRIDKVIEFSHSLRMTFIDKDDKVDFDTSLFIGIAEGNINNIIPKAFTALKYSRKILSKFYFLHISDIDFDQNIQDDSNLKHIIRKSIFNGQIVPFYQPIYDNKEGKITKYECLARIIDNNDVIYPNAFFKIAREMGCMRRITFSVIYHSFILFKDNNYDFSINITEEDLRDNQVIIYLENNCTKFNINPSRIIIELLEDIEFGDDNVIINNILHLKNKGFKIAIDDFGYANSNFGRLIKMSVDYIKIDGMFIKNIISDPMSYKIVEAITNFAKSINIKCIAEYVHNEEVQNIITRFGIDYSQGHYIGEASSKLEVIN